MFVPARSCLCGGTFMPLSFEKNHFRFHLILILIVQISKAHEVLRPKILLPVLQISKAHEVLRPKILLPVP